MRSMGKKPWSPYVAGALAGAVLCLSVLVAGQYFGASTTYVRVAGLIEQSAAPERVSAMDYFVKTGIKIDWQMMFVVGIIIGSFVSALHSRNFAVTLVPPMWKKRFGPGIVRRSLYAFVGGVFALFGARLAGG